MSLMVMKYYSQEFKADAVALFHSDPDLTIAQVARDLGVNAETLRNWIRKDRTTVAGGRTARKKMTSTTSPAGDGGPSLEDLRAENEALRAELRAARKETATVSEERDILRKATKFFAQEMSW